eukprot:gene6879-13953_t
MDKTFYESDVSFMDPLLDITGIDNYQSNVDMLAGRNMFGSFLFKDASIALHSIVKPSENKLMTKWTLRVTVKAIPTRWNGCGSSRPSPNRYRLLTSPF